MSGGSMEYFYWTLENYVDSLEDVELNDLMHDIAKLYHDKEWADSGDYCDGDWNKTKTEFKNKWFKAKREDRLLGYIDKEVARLKNELIEPTYCMNCKHWDWLNKADDYGECEFKTHCLSHAYENICDKFEKSLDK